MARVEKKEVGASLDILKIERGSFTVAICGRTPLIMNRLSEKAKQQLLFPAPPKTKADKAANLKHDPIVEFRAAAHRITDESAPTLLAIPTTALKGAMRTAALEMPGTTKAQIGRLTYIDGSLICVYGIPQVLCSVTRMADAARTPDVRTRVIVPRWAAVATITYVQPQLKGQAVSNLLSAAGVMMGVGDWRPEKGSGSYGQFDLCDPDDPAFLEIVKTGGRAAQQEALDHPTPYDEETAELLSWFNVELRRRGFKTAA